MLVAAPSLCDRCDAGEPVMRVLGEMAHIQAEPGGILRAGNFKVWRCGNYDSECRHIAEPLGFYRFAWRGVTCRNGKFRWLRWVECHRDGTYSLGNRAH